MPNNNKNETMAGYSFFLSSQSVCVTPLKVYQFNGRVPVGPLVYKCCNILTLAFPIFLHNKTVTSKHIICMLVWTH